jgi:hypothetical protein
MDIRSYDFLFSKKLGDIDKLSIPMYGRLGNNVLQLVNGIAIAHAVGARLIQYAYGNFFGMGGNISVYLRFLDLVMPSGLSLQAIKSLPACSSGFSHTMMDSTRVDSLVSRTIQINANCHQDIACFLDILLDLLPWSENQGSTNCLIHVRGEDVFGGFANINHLVPRGYTQPPYAFYTKAVSELLNTCNIDEVVLQVQDNNNPCAEYLAKWLEKACIGSYRMACGTLDDSVKNILGATHLISSRGTFVPLLGLISSRCQSITYFRRPEVCHLSDLFLSAGKESFLLQDSIGLYTPEQEWMNISCQLRLMLAYPESFLSARFALDRDMYRSLGEYVYL